MISTTLLDKQKEKEQSYPCIKQRKDDLVVLFHSPNAGFVIKSNLTFYYTSSILAIGVHKCDWREIEFKLIPGVILENS